MAGFDMKDYVPVNERVGAFYDEYPHGSIQSEIVELTDKRVTVKASAYRTPDDQRPGTGHSSLNIPGSTPYTKGSEIENAETSAWGRAIAALGFEVKRGIASAEEVRNKQSRAAEEPAAKVAGVVPAPATDDDLPPLQEPPVEQDDGLFDAVLAATGGTEVAEGILGECPDHQKPWRAKPAGTSRSGAKYPAFWTCPVQLDDGTYCKKRPLVAWEKTHPAERAA